MAKVYDLWRRLPRPVSADIALQGLRFARDSTNLMAAVMCVDEGHNVFFTFARDAQDPVLRAMFIFFARAMAVYAALSHDKVANEEWADGPRREKGSDR